MNVSLTPQLESFVKQKVDTGMYNSVSEVVREALRLLEQRDSSQQTKLEMLRKEIDIGIEQLDQGLGRPLDAESIKTRGRARLQQRKTTE